MVDNQPSDRSFGLLAGLMFLAVGLQPLLHGGHTRNWSLIGAADLLILAVVFPRSLRHAKRAWLYLGVLLGSVVNPVVLGALFYLVITPVGILLRLWKADPLRLNYSPGSASYWQRRTVSASRFTDQF